MQGNELANETSPEHIAYGSVITLRSQQHSGGLLHSHNHTYPEDMLGQQQVTAYCYRDDNNLWLIKSPHDQTSGATNIDDGVRFVRSGERIRLEHVLTRKNLHSHAFPATVGLKNLLNSRAHTAAQRARITRCRATAWMELATQTMTGPFCCCTTMAPATGEFVASATRFCLCTAWRASHGCAHLQPARARCQSGARTRCTSQTDMEWRDHISRAE